jgi:amidase
VSRTGIIPISITQDTAGPMARTVEDAAILLGVLAGVDSKDTSESKGKSVKLYQIF